MTIRQVASAAGVSITTVSLALRRSELIPAQTRKLVEEAARRLNYKKTGPGRPSRRPGQDLPAPRTNRIAMLISGLPRCLLSSPVYADVLHGVESELAKNGKVCALRYLPPEQVSTLTAFPQRVDGTILLCASLDPMVRAQLATMPCVRVMGFVVRDEPWDHVSYDNAIIGELAARYLVERGHRHVAMVAPPPSESDSTAYDVLPARRDGFCRSLRAAGVQVGLVNAEPIFDLSGSHQRVVQSTATRIVDQLLKGPSRPTALFCPHDLLTAALHPLLLARGVHPGKEIDLISCNNEGLLLQSLHPRPATIDIHAADIGRRAVEQLLWRMVHPNSSRSVVTLDPTLITTQDC